MAQEVIDRATLPPGERRPDRHDTGEVQQDYDQIQVSQSLLTTGRALVLFADKKRPAETAGRTSKGRTVKLRR